MPDETRQPPQPPQPREGQRWPDEEGAGEAQKSLRSDVGASMERPKEEESRPPEATGPGGQRGAAGSGQVPGRGKLGSQTPTEKGAEQGPR